MADEPQYDSLTLVGLHEPDVSLEGDGAGGYTRVELPGFYSVGFVKDGAFRRLATFKAAGLFADIRRAQQAQTDAQGQQSSGQQQPGPAPQQQPAGQGQQPGQQQPAPPTQ